MLEDDNDGYRHSEESYEMRLETARRLIRDQRDFTSQAKEDEFFHQFADIATITTKAASKTAGNLLHVLIEVVKHNGLKPEHVERLARRLVEESPDLLWYPNKEGQTPILMAIRTCQDRLLNYMISACVKNNDRPIFRECLHSALSAIQDGKTCLHAAFNEKLKPETTRMLIENASDEALGIRDHTGKTPMHHAVLFRHCSDDRVRLIDLFIQKDCLARLNKPKSESTFLDLLDKDGYSVYREHRNNRKSFTKQHKVRQTARADKRDHADAPRPAERPPPREPKPQGSTRDPKPAPPARASGDRDTERYSRGRGAGGITDDREQLRQRKKEEERARQEQPGLLAKNDRPKDRDFVGRDASRNRSTRVNETAETDTRHAVRPLDPAPNTSIKRRNTGHVENGPSESEKRRVGQDLTARQIRHNANAMAICTKNSDKILQKLKLYYMRSRTAEMVIFFLYGKNMDDVQTGFDYYGLPRQIVWKEWTKRFGKDHESGLKFDRVLQYATFPRVDVLVRGRLTDLARSHQLQAGVPEQGAHSRKDIKYFLDWLYEKGVRHIIKLSVEDSGDSGQKVHGDQVIQESLERFVIEHLDWQKTDLDPETILHVSSRVPLQGSSPPDGPDPVDSVPDRQLKKLSLMWSGSNAVLRAWSEPDALPLLPHLQEVEITRPPPQKTYDSPQWINKKFEEFETRLNKSRKEPQASITPISDGLSDVGTPFSHVKVTAVDPGTGDELQVAPHIASPVATSAQNQGVNAHRWLDSAVRFASAMAPFWENTVREFLELRQNRGTAERVEGDVVLALIDDGVDKFDIGLSSQVLEGKSFDFHDERVRPPFLSAKGHGTVMASMILRVCPMAKVYPIRLKTYNNANGKSTIDAKYAAQAIQAALDKNAAIISMSWTLPMANGKDDTKDQRKFTELDYPSGPWRDHFFRIGAAHSNGTVFQWTHDDGITYVFPGVDVIQDQARSSSLKQASEKEVASRVKDLTGSSVATALGAGLAAMVIYCVKASILAAKTASQNKAAINPIPDDRAMLVADPDAMKGAIASLGMLTSNGFVQIWEQLDKASNILEKWQRERSSPEAGLKCTRDFMNFGIKLTNSVKQ
ncbi:intracellular serine protease [Fusarium albosuccineum]|uniref:Intracellular serine protease n=1 Tax=Fusarium albosuccineum TaxID=1237068 RepID=A0A8H4PAZ9_9HYPO|nr:intracellular serine protease [Fusarium albosuccineum]